MSEVQGPLSLRIPQVNFRCRLHPPLRPAPRTLHFQYNPEIDIQQAKKPAAVKAPKLGLQSFGESETHKLITRTSHNKFSIHDDDAQLPDPPAGHRVLTTDSGQETTVAGSNIFAKPVGIRMLEGP